jgi:TonB family protein
MPVRIASSFLEPIYPGRAAARRQEAKVIVSAVIRHDGWISDLKLERTDSENDEFAISAAQTVGFWRYRPALVDGCPVPTRLLVNVTYHR